MAFPLSRPAKLAVFASGRGSNLASLLRAFPPENGLAELCLLISNKAEAQALERARDAGINAVYVPYSTRENFEADTRDLLIDHEIDLICLAGFMRILSAEFVEQFAGQILNIHPSLLPKFPGLHAQRQALAAGVKTSGCTVHFVDAGVDTGPIVLQKTVAVLAGDTEESLAERILQEEHVAYPEAVTKVLTGKMGGKL